MEKRWQFTTTDETVKDEFPDNGPPTRYFFFPQLTECFPQLDAVMESLNCLLDGMRRQPKRRASARVY